jgi:hypothetical protein
MFPEKGICNGTRLKVTKILNNLIEVEILKGPFEGTRCFLPKIKLISQGPYFKNYIYYFIHIYKTKRIKKKRSRFTFCFNKISISGKISFCNEHQ